MKEDGFKSAGLEQTPCPVWIKPQFAAALHLWHPRVTLFTSPTEARRGRCDDPPPKRNSSSSCCSLKPRQSSAATLCLYHEKHPSLTFLMFYLQPDMNQSHSFTLRKQEHHTGTKSSPCIHFYCFAQSVMTGWTTGCHVLHWWWASVHQNNCSLTLWHDSDHGGQHLHLFVVGFSHHYDII